MENHERTDHSGGSGLCGMAGCFGWPWGNGCMTALCQIRRPTDSVTVIVHSENSPRQLSKSPGTYEGLHCDYVGDSALGQEAQMEADPRHMDKC